MSDAASLSDFPQTAIRALRKIAPDDRLHAAALDFDQLQERKSHPDGKYDNAKHFVLGIRYSCCTGIRVPSRGFPFSELVHGRTALHVAHAHGMPERVADIRCYRRLIQKHPELRALATKALSVLAAHEAGKALEEIDALLRGDRPLSKRRKSGSGDGQ